MRILLVILPILLLVSCGMAAEPDYLAYQDAALTVDGEFTIDDASFPATLVLAAAEYDESGRMLARNASLTMKDNSIIAGVRFEIADGAAYVCAGVLKIPLSDDTVIAGILDLVSLFCIDGSTYYSAEEEGEEIRVTYISGDNRAVMLWDPSTSMPTAISAEIDGKSISAEIGTISAE